LGVPGVRNSASARGWRHLKSDIKGRRATVPVVKAEVTYELHSLGWHGFQQLCSTILREILGQTVSAFLDVRDGGRDGGFRGRWKQQGTEHISGTFVVQCKFTNRASHNLAVSDVVDELEKAERLVKAGLCDNYFLLTNAGISGVAEEELRVAFTKVGVKHFVAFGYTWICDTIRDNKRLRMLVPRVYGLGDLSQILDERSYAQARALLRALQDDLSKVVLTGTYDRAAKMLEKHGFVLLIGEPAAEQINHCCNPRNGRDRSMGLLDPKN
jgi:hypothetical protein